MKNPIEEVLIENIKNQNCFFVFPTQMAADLWADRIISVSSVSAVAMERFMAWDAFKGSSIKSKQQQKTAIPSKMRKIFVDNLISKNKEEHFLKKLISKEYAQTAGVFSNWISSMLPSLDMWKKYFEKSKEIPDEEDADLFEIYTRYSNFLEQHGLFDPAWETPPFESDGKKYFVFYPEILADYGEYEQILKSAPSDITLIFVPKNENLTEEIPVNFYSDSRVEIKNVALFIQSIHNEKKIDYKDIVINVPDLESYEPYIKRELSLYQIPFLTRNAVPLGKTGAGVLFSNILECITSNFNFESLRKLLSNKELPWKEEHLNSELIAFGKAKNCICSFKYNEKEYDVWLENFRQSPKEENLLTFYEKLKLSMKKLEKADSFSKLRDAYFSFRETFFNMDLCAAKTDMILSRCIVELGEFIDLEEEYGIINVQNPFNFFVNHINQEKYLEQTETQGVQIVPYRLAATCPFPCQIVLDSSQSSLAIMYKQLSFLRDDKRQKLLKKEDTNVTDLFIKLYHLNATSGFSFFSAAERTFSGYAQACSYLKENDLTKIDILPDLQCFDFYKSEKAFFIDSTKSFPSKVTEISKNGFEFWAKCQKNQDNDFIQAQKIIKETVQTKIQTQQNQIRVSATSLNQFFLCPRFWLAKRVSNIQPQNSEAELINPFAIGNLEHLIMQNFLQFFLENDKIIEPIDFENSVEFQKLLIKCIEKGILMMNLSFLAKELLKTTTQAINATLQKTIFAFCQKFEGYKVWALEKAFDFFDSVENVLCEGKIDCILYNPTEGGYTIVDFKSTQSAFPSFLTLEEAFENEDIPDFQAAMYFSLLENQTPPISAESFYFFAIKPDLNGNHISKKSQVLDRPEFEPTMEFLKKSIHDYAEAIKQNNFEPNNVAQDYLTCNSCDHRAICRRTFNVCKSNS